MSPKGWGCTYPADADACGRRVPIRSFPVEWKLTCSEVAQNLRWPNISLVRQQSHLVHTNDKMATNEIPIPRDPTEDEALALFKAIEEKFPSKSLGDDKWYVLTVRNTIHSPDIHLRVHSMPLWSAEDNPALHPYCTKSSSSDLNTQHPNSDKG